MLSLPDNIFRMLYLQRFIVLFVFIFSGIAVPAQHKLTMQCKDISTNEPVEKATIAVNNINKSVADEKGEAILSLPAGTYTISCSAIGYAAQTVRLGLTHDTSLVILLNPVQTNLADVTLIASTRNNQRIENAPLKVEVLGREEMDEENTIKPGNIASILGDVSGIQIQQSSATSGNSNVRIQGLDGRYTQILRDGLPLYDGFSGGFGILSIPPLDLKQVELIKGSASTLYGGGAIGGLINIISRKPTAKQEAVFTLNQSTLQETNVNTFLSRRNSKTGYTFFGGYTLQKNADVNKDGFSDVPDIHALIIHPRLFFYPGNKTTIVAGYTAIFEKRAGGDMQVLNGKADAFHQYFEKNSTQRHSGEILAERKLKGASKLELKSSISSFNRAISANSHYFKGRQFDYYSELALLVPYKKNNLVAGVNIVGDRFSKLQPSDPTPLENFSNNTVGLFLQHTWNIEDKTILEAGIRNDYHPAYGNFFLPRAALFHRFSDAWAVRAGIGFGYKTPNPLSPQVLDYAIEHIQPLPAGIRAERSVGYNAEVNYKKEWENGNELFINHAFFLTQISHPVIADEGITGDVVFSNASKSVITEGFDTYVRSLVHNWEIYAGYTFTIAERKYLQQNQFIPLTPKHRMAFTLVRDFEEKGWRIGLEGSYNGPQYRVDRSKTPGYFFMAAMVEKKFGKKVSLVLNGENLLDFRQSKKEALYTGTLTNPVFNPLWAPIDGRVINLSVKIMPCK